MCSQLRKLTIPLAKTPHARLSITQAVGNIMAHLDAAGGQHGRDGIRLQLGNPLLRGQPGISKETNQ